MFHSSKRKLKRGKLKRKRERERERRSIERKNMDIVTQKRIF